MHSNHVRSVGNLGAFATDHSSLLGRSSRSLIAPVSPPMIAPQTNRYQPSVQPVSDHLDTPDHEAWLAPAAQEQRRDTLGITGVKEARFVENCEFISLGCYCAVTRALQALGLKKYTYPFDWTRSPASGIVHCLENSFSDFLTHELYEDHGSTGKCFGKTKWGGSFWHHDPTDAKTKSDMNRRIRRLLGKEEVPRTTPRVFVRAVNDSSEVHGCLSLFEALKQALPESKVYLLLLVDYQRASEMLCIEGVKDSVIVCMVDKSLFADNGAAWTMQKQAEAYALALASAIRFWAGDTKVEPGEMVSVTDVTSTVVPFDAGDAAYELFFPKDIAASVKGADVRPSRSACAAVARSVWSPRDMSVAPAHAGTAGNSSPRDRSCAPARAGAAGNISSVSQAPRKNSGACFPSVQLASASIGFRMCKSPPRNAVKLGSANSFSYSSQTRVPQSPVRARPVSRVLAQGPFASACVR